MILSQLIPFLKRIDARPKKNLSQNFLVDPQVIAQILKIAEVQPDDLILEIGPGPGALTEALLKMGARVYAVEMDSLFAKELERFQNGRLQVFQADFLKFPLERLPQGIKVVANLPYHITTPILEKLFTHPFSNLTIMVQKEVAERMKAAAGTKIYGSLSLFVQFYTKIGQTFTVPPASFYPQPKIDSTVIRLDATTLPNVNPVHFFTLVHKAFQQRRKMITSSILFPKERLRDALEKSGARVDARPEMLSLNQWVQLTNELKDLFP
jgi:16S rRNA (adenine1518-N6/adenine1519-N6)-dimethyltransferase